MSRYVWIGSLVLGMALVLTAEVAAAQDAYVKILSPANGAKWDAMAQNKIRYDVKPGPRGDHIHVYVDDKEVGILRQLKGSYTLETIPSGSHNLCIKVVNKGHTPIGVEKCVQVAVD